jgi:hypothetical protein
MGLLDLIRGKDPVFTGTIDPKWVRNPKGKFYRLFDLDPGEAGLAGVGGVYVIWHGGVHPEWVFVGETNDLASAFVAASVDDDIQQYEINGHLFVTWSPVLEKYRPGVVLYLAQTMEPLVENPAAPSSDRRLEPIKVAFPSRTVG